jgi:diguanylate cyclase (GGDEF)-like protein
MNVGIDSFILYVIISFLGLLAAGFGTFLFFNKNILLPVKQIYNEVLYIKNVGDLSYRIPVGREDEFGQFSRSFNNLLDVIEEQTEELTRKNITLHEQANRDELTGLYNKRYFSQWLDTNSLSKQSLGDYVSFLMLDIDHFKLYNDRYGHIAGDVCIRSVADALNRVVTRPTDFSLRYGGEEFVIILADTDEKGAESVAGKILKEILSLKIENADSSVSPFLTVSIGGACDRSAGSPEILKQLLIRADGALYQSKNNGRNRYTFWKEEGS